VKPTIVFATILSLLAVPLWAKPRPAPPDAPAVGQWKDLALTMAELVEQGYTLVSTAASGDQDEITTYYLAKGAELVRCRDGIVLTNNRGFVSACARLVRPYRLEQ
jgi:hypothetical protein